MKHGKSFKHFSSVYFSRIGKVFLNSIEYLDPVTMEWTTFVNRQADESRSESACTSRRDSILAPVDEEVGEQKAIDQADSSGNESDEHSS